MMASSSLTRPVELSSQPAVARRELTRLLADQAWDGDVDGVILAVHEAMVNSQRHGGGVIRASVCVDTDTVMVEISDRGRGYQLPETPGLADATAERGRGLLLIRRLSADAYVERFGADVRLTLTFAR